MNVADTIREKVVHLPPKAQEEALREIEQIEVRYSRVENDSNKNGDKTHKHPLTLIAELACDVGVTDFAERHDFYAHGKLED